MSTLLILSHITVIRKNYAHTCTLFCSNTIRGMMDKCQGPYIEEGIWVQTLGRVSGCKPASEVLDLWSEFYDNSQSATKFPWFWLKNKTLLITISKLFLNKKKVKKGEIDMNNKKKPQTFHKISVFKYVI